MSNPAMFPAQDRRTRDGIATTLYDISLEYNRKVWVWSRKYFKSFLVVNKQTKTTQQQPFYGPLSGTTRVSSYQKKHSPTHHP